MISSGNNGGGILSSTMVGVNYSDELGKYASLNSLSLLYSKNNKGTRSVSDRTTLLTNYVLRTKSQNTGENDNSQYSLGNSFRIKLDKHTNFYLTNSFLTNNGINIINGNSFTFRNGTLLN